ncbi:hypothetical protein CPB84DRAFT_558468 [Gymnopilus junonius]|uniref:Uncharacterized protein n=1 Tax=Gymnopilus junonius TaxID=109634 RepID=A0A9P5NAQ5_GYMJU|nr:hypothetical protein CPB84DRAFT_558468 [Gymnopilus junonius]
MSGTPQSASGKVMLKILEVGFPALGNHPMAPWFQMPYSPLDVSQLRRLTVSDPYCPVSHIDDILVLCSNALEELDFQVDLFANRLPLDDKTPNLGSLRNLSHLTARTCIRGYPYQQPTIREKNDLSYIAAVLKSLPFNSLRPQQLRIDIVMWIVLLPDFDTNLALLPWSDLISVLDDERFSSFFLKVDLKIRRFEYDLRSVHVNMTSTALLSILDKNEGLKKLREKGLLSYTGY